MLGIDAYFSPVVIDGIVSGRRTESSDAAGGDGNGSGLNHPRHISMGGPGGIFLAHDLSAGASANENFSRERASQSKARINYVLIPREGQVREDLKNLTWININDTNDSVLEWLEHNFNVCAEDIKRELASEENPSGCRYSNYLILKFDELADGIPSLSLNGRGLAHNRCVMVCADNFIITLSDNPLRSVSRVWSEVVNQQGCQDQPRSSNAVATRIIGSNLHINQGAVSILAEGVRSFIDKKNSKLPKSADLRWLRNMSAKLNACESALESMHDLIDRLEEQRNLFGEPKACDELDRYQRAVNLADGRIEHARRDLKDLGDSWRAADAKWQADVVYRLALITGLCTPISVVSSVFGSNFATMPPDSWMWAALCGAVVVSTTLVGALLYKKRAAERWE